MKFFLRYRLVLLIFAVLPAAPEPIYNSSATSQPVVAARAMAASQSHFATKAGLSVLKKGGSAADAAVAMALTLAVTLPRAGNLGGGGFALYYDKKSGKVSALDFREKAPSAAGRDMYLDDKGNVVPEKSYFSHQAIGVPGSPAGLEALHRQYGRLPWKNLFADAIVHAEKGIPVSHDLHASLTSARDISRYASSRAVFLPRGKILQPGELLVQKDLAAVLKRMAAAGAADFYSGKTAALLAADMKKNGGLITLQDLREYKPVWREALQGEYGGYRIMTMPPPSSGGVHLIEMLNILSHFPLKSSGAGSARTVHLMSEAMARAYADRSEFLGDPDFSKIPVGDLISGKYAAKLAAGIHAEKRTPMKMVHPGGGFLSEHPETTHFSVVDSDGNAASITTTLNFSYGMMAIAEGTGILWNNEMDDFSVKPGVANAYGLIGGSRNAVAPGKRMLSSMTPTMVFRGDKLHLVTGSPGGSRIITTVLQVVVNMTDFGMNVAEAAAAPRFHFQWAPDILYMEKGFSPDTIAILKGMGYHVEMTSAMGSTQSIHAGELLYGSSDPRKPDALTEGY